MINLIPFGLKKIADSFSAKINRRYNLKVKPRYLNWIITYKCNSRCQMCNIWQKYADEPQLVKKELTLEEIREFLTKNKEFLSEVEHIGITGGEPFLREDLVEIIKTVRQILPKAATGPQTNGFLPELIKKKLEKIVKFYPEVSLAISLDGLGKTHDMVRGIKGAFQKMEKTISYAQRLGVKRITCGMTLSNTNYSEILKVRNFVEGFGGEFSCFLPDEADYFGNLGQGLKLSSKAKKEIIKVLKKNFSYHYYMDNLRRFLESDEPRRLPCYSGYYSLTIDPYGNVLPCILKSESFGNIKKASLEEILFNPKSIKIKNNLKSCRCWSQCEISTSVLADSMDILRWFPSCGDKKRFLNKADQISKGLQ